jgi:7-carboxy-7-deazaguanine synthase
MARLETSVRTAAPVLEVFASIQGEGMYVGEPQVFLRLRGCPMRCRWCDTQASWTLSERDLARIDVPGAGESGVQGGSTQSGSMQSSGARRREPAWASPFQAACWIAEVEPGSPRTVSVTGGEPLLWPEFLLALRGMIGTRRLHLETAGGHPETLARVIDRCDHTSLDLKPDLDLDPPVEIVHEHATSERAPRTRDEWRRARRACLTIVAGRDACGKIVVSGERAPEDFALLLDEVESCAPRLRVFLQPATAIAGQRAPSLECLTAVCEMARDRDLDVRVVPQIHRFLKMP